MPAPYPQTAVVIIDPTNGTMIGGGSVRPYDAVADPGCTTPLEISSGTGVSLGTTLTANASGWTGEWTSPVLRVRLKGGDPGDLTQPYFDVYSGQGVIESAAASAVFAAAAQVAAEAAQVAAEGATGPADGLVAGFVTDGASATRLAMDAIFATVGVGSDPDAVKLTTDQSIDGVKTFTSAPVLPANALPISRVAGLQDSIDAAALDSELATTNGQVEGKVTQTPHNDLDIVVLEPGVTTIPGTARTVCLIITKVAP